MMPGGPGTVDSSIYISLSPAVSPNPLILTCCAAAASSLSDLLSSLSLSLSLSLSSFEQSVCSFSVRPLGNLTCSSVPANSRVTVCETAVKRKGCFLLRETERVFSLRPPATEGFFPFFTGRTRRIVSLCGCSDRTRRARSSSTVGVQIRDLKGLEVRKIRPFYFYSGNRNSGIRATVVGATVWLPLAITPICHLIMFVQKIETDKFDDKSDFVMLRRKMKAVLVQNKIAPAICSPEKYPESWKGKVLSEKLGDAHNCLTLHLTDNVLREIDEKDNAFEIWTKLEKTLFGKIFI
ncbi:hypothetical protein M9H77_08843 [Catharanthus roseus]|uniref:Uncharacterized protein n=1 Tax=Catharanthus roseus TaxID=4058 RepID=A0ACC0BZD2_CATRO|nr:hypothetical protein M9H77_08843 [Catharanthus roseus]